MRIDKAGKTRLWWNQKEGETMSLEAIQKVTEIEKQMLEKRTAAEAEARMMIAEAEKRGEAMLQKMRNEAAESGKMLAMKAEDKAKERSAEIQRAAETESNTLREIANRHMDEAVEFIVGRVVNH